MAALGSLVGKVTNRGHIKSQSTPEREGSETQTRKIHHALSYRRKHKINTTS